MEHDMPVWQRAARAGFELTWAVTDGPDGEAVMPIPEDATELQRRLHRGEVTLHCSRLVGGCGGELLVAAGTRLRHHYRHMPRARCSLTERAARENYTHLAIQRGLVTWLQDQGLTTQAEYWLGKHSRVDVFVGNLCHVLEVQLSPLGTVAWEDRHRRYSQSVDEVTWLNGEANTQIVDEQILRSGFSLTVKFDQGSVRLGVSSALNPVWAPLDQWKMTADGPTSKPLENVLGELEYLARRRAAAGVRQLAQRRARDAPQRDEDKRPGPDPEKVSRLGQIDRETLSLPAAARPTSPVEQDFTQYPDYRDWVAAQDWSWAEALDDDLRAHVRAGTYYTTRIAVRGPRHLLPKIVGDPTGRVTDVLHAADLIILTDTAWQRARLS